MDIQGYIEGEMGTRKTICPCMSRLWSMPAASGLLINRPIAFCNSFSFVPLFTLLSLFFCFLSVLFPLSICLLDSFYAIDKRLGKGKQWDQTTSNEIVRSTTCIYKRNQVSRVLACPSASELQKSRNENNITCTTYIHLKYTLSRNI